VKKLVTSPESGMRYRGVNTRLRSGRVVKNLLVFNDRLSRQKVVEKHIRGEQEQISINFSENDTANITMGYPHLYVLSTTRCCKKIRT